MGKKKKKMGLALVDFIKYPTSSELSATKYTKAGGEVLVMVLALTWTITYFTRRDVISDNPLRDRLGYNNVCVGLDTKPASYVAALLWPFLSYFNILLCCQLSVDLYIGRLILVPAGTGRNR